TNEGWGFSGTLMAAAPDGSLHIAYKITDEGIYFRSHDGVTWDSSDYLDILSKATLVDYAPGNMEIDPPDVPADVKGGLRLLAPQDYEHVSVTLGYNGGSFSTPSFYYLRRCAPFIGFDNTWPAERLALSAGAFDPVLVAVDEHGMASILTPSGVRQDV